MLDVIFIASKTVAHIHFAWSLILMLTIIMFNINSLLPRCFKIASLVIFFYENKFKDIKKHIPL